MTKPKVLLFDLGGVIVRWVGLDELGKITGLNRDEVGARFAASTVFRDYEIGHCGDDVFAKALIAEQRNAHKAARKLYHRLPLQHQFTPLGAFTDAYKS